ncbi:MAG: DUF1761 domain-containing protein [Halobacteriovoraceae bacterium]|jgi:hypothetical protein|nr:DUF1761 domain-containing protein [Halobacteriovoraceae bacterium]
MGTELIFVITAAILNFSLSGLWYIILKKQWLVAWELDETKIDKRDPVPYLIAFIGSLWTSYGMFILLKHLQPKNVSELLTIAIGVWLLIIVGTSAKHYSFACRCVKAFLLDYIPDLIGLVIISFMFWRII